MIRKILQYKRIIGEAVELVRRNNELARQNIEISRQNNELSGQNVELSKQNIELSSQNIELSSQNKELSGQVIELSGQNNALSSQSIEFAGQNNDLARENNELIKQDIELSRQIIELSRQNSELAIQNNTHLKQLIEKMEPLELQLKLHHEITAVNTAAFAEYKNIHNGKEVVVLGSGPTLNKYIPIKGAIHIGVNSVCTNKKIALDFYFTQDFGRQPPRYSPYNNDIINLRCKKFFGILANTPNGSMEPPESFCIQANATRYFVDMSPSKNLHFDIRFHPLMDFYTVVFPALHFALFTNPKRIYLVGCDTSHTSYFTGEKLKGDIEETRIILNSRINGFRRLKEFARIWYPEIEIISINPVNLKGLFRDIFTDEHGTYMDDKENPIETKERDFSDVAIRDLVDRHIEQVLQD